MLSFSLIICTHNPKQVIFYRLLNAVSNFNKVFNSYEVIIVDNLSSPLLNEQKIVKDFLTKNSTSRLIIETVPGLTAARTAGIKAAKYEWLVFFDDDNEPAINYLETVTKAIEQHPQVGAWGAGDINVVYTDPVELWLESRKDLFQQKNISQTEFSKVLSWQDCYPFGTGMIIKKVIAEEYVNRVQKGRYTLTDRKGKSLSSGGDVQMLLTGIDMGYAAGSVAGLSLLHLIDKGKANLSYLQKQQYGTASAYIKAYNQVFVNNQIQTGSVSNISILKILYSLYRIHRSSLSSTDFKLLMASKLGEINATVSAANRPKPVLLKWYEKIINA